MSTDEGTEIGLVIAFIKKDLLACDFKVSLFAAALSSYRHDSCLKPFPRALVDNGSVEKDYKRLARIFKVIPKLECLISSAPIHMEREAWQLLHWILEERTFHVQSCNISTVTKEVSSQTGCCTVPSNPSHIFQVLYKTQGNADFDDRKGQYGVKYGYHGSRLDNFHSILHHGLQVHMMKNGLFGDGVYLAEDLGVSIAYTKAGTGWDHSCLGGRLSAVAICEALEHPGVKYKVENPSSPDDRQRLRAENSEGGDVPEKYFVVTSSDLVRIKYVYIFGERKKPRRSSVVGFVWRYPVATLLGLYIAFLLFMGLWRTSQVQQFYKRYFVNRFVTEH